MKVVRWALLIVSMPAFFVSFILPVQSRALGATALEIGGLFSLFSFSLIVLRPAVGWGLDVIGRKWIFVSAIGFYLSANLVYAAATGIQIMYVGRFLQGIGAAFLLLVADIITRDITGRDTYTPDINTPDSNTPDINTPDINTPDSNTSDSNTADMDQADISYADIYSRDSSTGNIVVSDVDAKDPAGNIVVSGHSLNQALGKNLEMQSRGSIVGATLGFSLMAVVPAMAWQLSFMAYSMLAAVALLMVIVRLRESGAVEVPTSSFSWSLNPGLIRLGSVSFASAFCLTAIQPVYIIFLKDNFDIASSMLALALLPAGIIYSVVPSKGSRLVRRWGELPLMSAGFLMTGLCYYWLPDIHSIWLFVIVYSATAVASALADPARKSFAMLMSPAGSVGRSFGFIEFMYGIGATLGPLSGGYLYDSFSPVITFQVHGVVLLITAVLAMIALRKFQSAHRSSD